ncbi:hypothetical protein CU098_003138, partial [Rhizopus stolonifer]
RHHSLAFSWPLLRYAFGELRFSMLPSVPTRIDTFSRSSYSLYGSAEALSTIFTSPSSASYLAFESHWGIQLDQAFQAVRKISLSALQRYASLLCVVCLVEE